MPKIARLLDEAERRRARVLRVSFRALAQAALNQPAERFNREIGRRTDVVGIFPDDPSLIRLVSMLAIEANDKWLVGRSYISQGSMATLYETRTTELSPPTSTTRRSPSSPPREPPHRRDELTVLHHVPGLDSRAVVSRAFPQRWHV